MPIVDKPPTKKSPAKPDPRPMRAGGSGDAGRDEREDHGGGIFSILREWGDALIIAFVLAMFVRVFVVELFKIPTGSMTPTLLGDYIAEVDLNNDERVDLVVQGANQTLVFMNKGDRYEPDDQASESLWSQQDVLAKWRREGILKPEYDRILVNKFAYWTGGPARGDVVVFKVPDAIWDPNKPIYIKRAIGLPGDEISFEGRLVANGQLVEEPVFFRHQKYINRADNRYAGFVEQPFVRYRRENAVHVAIEQVKVPEDGLYVLGDNTRSSLDSRFWGAVPIKNLKGKAFLRYWPIRKLKFIH